MIERWVVKLTAEGDSASNSYYACKDSPSRLTSKQSRAWIFSRYDALTEANTWGRSWQPRIVRLRPKAPQDFYVCIECKGAFPKHLPHYCPVHPPKPTREQEAAIREAERPRLAGLVTLGVQSIVGLTHVVKLNGYPIVGTMSDDSIGRNICDAILAATWPPPEGGK